ncbi:hypothetical protein [Paenibacillus sp. BIC5C1]|uniref:hypothetical protein n=1 Tax=Paenibacillus sp. BIC5C1 TaxID=3078263 RepID=UPI0028E8DD22|nr:hypothetical protein [Paenibacillus sp. BIC5C1]
MDMRNLKLINYCWGCGAEHDASEVNYDQNATDKTVKCHCGGNIVTPSGKVQLQVVPAVPVWLIEDGSETFRVAAADDEQALQFMIDDWGMEDIEDVEVTVITDQEELRRKFILSEEGSKTYLSIMDVLNQTEKFPTLISTSIW